MLQRQISKDTPNVISLPESAAGPKPSVLQGGQQIALSGLDLVPANHLAAQANGKGQKTSGTCGRSSTGSSESANRPSCSGNRSHPQKLSERSLKLLSLSRFKAAITQERINSLNDSLQANLSTTINGGSMEYEQTWKPKITPSGLRYWAHTASTRRTSDKDYTGWPTPRTMDTSNESWETKQKRNARHLAEGRNQGKGVGGMTLPMAAQQAGWPTPRTSDANGAGEHGQGGKDLRTTAQMAGWMTPTVEDAGRNGSLKDYMKYVNERQTSGCRLRAQVHSISGQTPSGSPARTEKRGALNPNHSRWLMGYRAEWLCSEVLETLSSRK